MGPPFRAPAGGPPADGIQFTLTRSFADGGARTLRLGFGDSSGAWLSDLTLPTNALPADAWRFGWVEISNLSCSIDGRPLPSCIGGSVEFGEITRLAGPFPVPEPALEACWVALLTLALAIRLRRRPAPPPPNVR